MAKLSFKSKSSSNSNKLTIKHNYYNNKSIKYKKFLIASIILNIIFSFIILTTIK